MTYDWSKYDGNPDSLPQEERLKMRAAWDRTPATDPLDALLRGNAKDEDEDAPLTRSDIRGIFEEAQRKTAFSSELESVRSTLSAEDYAKYAPAAKPHIERGLGPRDAFRLASFDDTVALATTKARTEALSGVQTDARNKEQPARGTGSSGAPQGTAATGNKYIDDPELYQKERKRLGSARTDFKDAMKFRAEEPDFVAAEKYHKDLVGVPRR